MSATKIKGIYTGGVLTLTVDRKSYSKRVAKAELEKLEPKINLYNSRQYTKTKMDIIEFMTAAGKKAKEIENEKIKAKGNYKLAKKKNKLVQKATKVERNLLQELADLVNNDDNRIQLGEILKKCNILPAPLVDTAKEERRGEY